jgi:hypothetical protein
MMQTLRKVRRFAGIFAKFLNRADTQQVPLA